MKKFRVLYNSRWFDVILFAIYVLIPFLVYYDLYADGMLPISGDGLGFFEMRFFTINSVCSGELPLWNSTLANGIPWAADFYGVFYPIQWLLSGLSVQNFVYFFYILHIAIGGFFTYKFLREAKIQKSIAGCVGVVYLLSTHIGGLRKSHMVLIVCIVYFPLILFLLEKFINSLKKKYLIGAAVAMAMAFYSGGHVQILLYMDIVLGIYLICMLVHKRIPFTNIVGYGTMWVLTYVGLIAMQLIPAAEMLVYYAKSGAVETSYETFNSFSIHPIKLVMMLFPEIFNGEIYRSMGINYSSEMDIEIFLGVSVIGMIALCISKIIKDFQVKVYIGMAIGAFLFAAQAHIPVLSKIIFKIPLISSFRVSSRILFVFIFFILCIWAKALNMIATEISDGRVAEIQRYAKCCWRTVICSIIGWIFIGMQVILFQYDGTNSVVEKSQHIFNICKNFIGIAILGGFIFKVLPNLLSKLFKYKNIILANFLVVATVLPIMETYRYTTCTNGISVQEIEENDEFLKELAADIGTGKILLASPYINGEYESPIACSKNLSSGVPTINAYISINNPNLFKLMSYNTAMQPAYNFSGLYTGFLDMSNNLLFDNDILSMLGVRYIIDQENLISSSGGIVSEITDSEEIYKDLSSVAIPDCDGQIYAMLTEPLNIKNNTCYAVSFEISSDEEQQAYIDFYGGIDYDNPAQQAHITIEEGSHSYEVIICSGECEHIEEIVCRLVCTPDSQLTVSNMIVNEQEMVWQDGVYTLTDNKKANVYVNNNAEEVIFAVDSVIGVETVEDIYQNRRRYDFTRNSYVEGISSFDCADAIIENIVMNNNSVKADVTCEGKAFVNFSQNFYPGWNAYVDGIKVDNYQVNGLIQGAIVEAGKHVIEFKFEPTSIYVGGGITLFTLLIIIVIAICKKQFALGRKDAKDNKEL